MSDFKKFSPILALLILLAAGCQPRTADHHLVIWITGSLHGDWLPHGEYAAPSAGGLSAIARALEIYRQPGDLLVDLGQFRYPIGVNGDTRRWRIKANGFLKSLLRLNYTAINVSSQDLPPEPPELAARAREYDLPLLCTRQTGASPLFSEEILIDHPAGAIRILALTDSTHELLKAPIGDLPGFTLLLCDATDSELRAFCSEVSGIDLVIWLNSGQPTALEIEGIPILALGAQGNCLGRLEIRDLRRGINLKDCNLSGWLDGKPFRHHPAREALLSKLAFWRKPSRLTAYLWQVPDGISPQKQAEAQRRQTQEEISQYDHLEEIHQNTPTDYTGSARCLECHAAAHPEDLATRHGRLSEVVKNYPNYERCLACHATGFDDPAGFLAPPERPDLLQVGCEACHGGARQHAQQGQRPYPAKPGEEICIPCHDSAALPAEHAQMTNK